MNESFDLKPVKSFFEKCIQDHGESPLGVGWNSEISQTVRFDQLLKLIEAPSFSLLDYGCGYGALAEYMTAMEYDVDYYGFDILKRSITMARKANKNNPRCSFFSDRSALPVCDYTVASGPFNFMADYSFDAWTAYVIKELEFFNQISRKGFASNFLTKYSDPEKMRSDLYYADPLYLFDYCKRNFSKNVALLHDYTIYDFTIIVRKK